MNKYFGTPALAAGLLTVLTVSAAQAQTVQLTSAPAGFSATMTDPYPLNNDNGGFIDGPFSVALGSTNVTYTAVNSGLHSFETFDNADGALDYPLFTNLIDTFDTKNPTGPFLINFSSGVTSFGINADSSQADTAIYSFTAYSGDTIIGQYTLAPVSQTLGDPHSAFIGAQTTSNLLITSVKISDTSIATNNQFTDTSGTNDFYVGPLSTYAPVPEASTTVSFGLLLMLGVSGAAFSARRKAAAKAASV